VPSGGRDSAANLNLQPDENERLANFRAKLAPAEALEEPVSLTDGLMKPAKRLITGAADRKPQSVVHHNVGM
jgi:hypothetical protein